MSGHRLSGRIGGNLSRPVGMAGRPGQTEATIMVVAREPRGNPPRPQPPAWGVLINLLAHRRGVRGSAAAGMTILLA